ncbi:MAG: outer-membrane lipoprotein carrier protein LolA [Alsobacter sp.]
MKAPHRLPISWGMLSRLVLPLVLAAGLAAPAWAQSGPLQLPPASLPGLPALPAPPKPKAIPVPKPRPSGLEAGVATPEPAAPRATATPAPAAPEPVIQQAALDVSPQAVLDRVNASLNSMTQVTADFIQVGGNGRRLEGKLYVQKPGRLRFEYKVAPIEIIADGNSVVIRDRKLGTQDVYPLSQTPLKFLLKDRIDLARDTKVLDVQGGPDMVSALIEDRTTFGGTSRVEMNFDPRSYALRQWTVTDPQGYQTTVNIRNVDLRTRPDPELFHVDTQRVLGEGR